MFILLLIRFFVVFFQVDHIIIESVKEEPQDDISGTLVTIKGTSVEEVIKLVAFKKVGNDDILKYALVYL